MAIPNLDIRWVNLRIWQFNHRDRFLFGLNQSEKNEALFAALEVGNPAQVQKMLDKGADPNCPTRNYGPILCRALIHSNEDTALACAMPMVAKGASLVTQDGNSHTALHYVCWRNPRHLRVMKALLQAGSDVNTVDRFGQTPLMTVVLKKEWAAAGLLLDSCGPDDKSASPVLIAAVANGAPVDLLSRMVEKFAIDVKAQTGNEGSSVLHAAVAAGHQAALEWALGPKKIYVDLRNQKGQTALQLAVAAGRRDMVQALLGAGAAPDTRDDEGNVPLVTATRNDNQEIVEMLVNAKADLDAADVFGVTALSAASSAGSIRMVKTLLTAAESAGVKLNLEPALFAAAERGHGRVLELLIAAGADVNHIDSEGRTPLMRAVNADQVETLSILIKAGAKPDIGDRHGMFAYDHAVGGGKLKAKDYLARYRHDPVTAAEPAAVAASANDFHYMRVSDHSLEVREGDGLTMTFNFWTQQVIFRDTERPAPVTVQNFADLQRQEAIEEAYAKLKELGGNPPDPRVGSIQKKMPGLK